jgi:hypothetical protein
MEKVMGTVDKDELKKIKRREQGREWRKNNPDKVRAYSKKYYEANKEKVMEWQHAYVKKNKIKIFNRSIKQKIEKDPDADYRNVMQYIKYLEKLD